MTSYWMDSTEIDEWLGVHDFKRFTDSQFPEDTDLPFWTWGILLQDMLFFLNAYPGQNVQGCQYQLDVRHVYTGQTREEWIESVHVYDIFDLRNPRLWLIHRRSLLEQYHRLFVYDPDWHCRDETDHSRLMVRVSPHYAELAIDSLVPRERRDEWREQVRVQNINPCVYSILTWWIATSHQFRL